MTLDGLLLAVALKKTWKWKLKLRNESLMQKRCRCQVESKIFSPFFFATFSANLNILPFVRRIFLGKHHHRMLQSILAALLILKTVRRRSLSMKLKRRKRRKKGLHHVEGLSRRSQNMKKSKCMIRVRRKKHMMKSQKRRLR